VERNSKAKTAVVTGASRASWEGYCHQRSHSMAPVGDHPLHVSQGKATEEYARTRFAMRRSWGIAYARPTPASETIGSSRKLAEAAPAVDILVTTRVRWSARQADGVHGRTL